MRQSSFVIDIEFSKQKELIYISHLDVVRLFMRTFRRADLPLVYTQGYNPHPKISFKRALRLGVKGNKEKMTMYCTHAIDIKSEKKNLNALLPKGVTISKMVHRRER
ncbi:MAG: TIGR03936 family radical SAM-associated protein [Candidatus Omnitrophica bacterium]|nr:TIGR03936 family radical SAM-associated protein [Candidatus Omnitrophota bacterium]